MILVIEDMDDIWVYIFKHSIEVYTNDSLLNNEPSLKYFGSNYKSICLVSKYFYKVVRREYFNDNPSLNKIKYMQDKLDYMIMKFPNERWDWQNISKNKNISLPFVKKYIRRMYVRELPNNPSFTKEILDYMINDTNIMTIPEELKCLFYDIDYIEQNIDTFSNNCWLYISKNKNVLNHPNGIDFIEKYFDKLGYCQ